MRTVLATINARYSHASFGLRYLLANMGSRRADTQLLEFTLGNTRDEMIEAVLAADPQVVGFGVYIWNVVQTTAVVSALKALRPGIVIVIGGPEVSYEYEGTEIFRLADYLITSEADLAFPKLIADLEAGAQPPKVIEGKLETLDGVLMPYGEYTDTDIRQRLIYVEASRGCPFSCEFCLSSLDIPVRVFPLEAFLGELKSLLERGARAFKFVDRTFNLNVKFASSILEFCLGNYKPGFELHFEMVPDRLPVELRALIARFPADAVQFEIGVQTLTADVSARISRRQNVAKMEENFRFLRDSTGVHIHADLIFGLPGETLETFGVSFNRLLTMGPQEIQMGILKRLKGTPIARHTKEFGMVYSSEPPYEIFETSTVPFADVQRMKRFARYFELYQNKGHFEAAMELLYKVPLPRADDPFASFLRYADWLWAKTRKTHEFAPGKLYENLFRYLVDEGGLPAKDVALTILADFDRKGVRKERPEFLRPYLDALWPLKAEVRAGHGPSPL